MKINMVVLSLLFSSFLAHADFNKADALFAYEMLKDPARLIETDEYVFMSVEWADAEGAEAAVKKAAADYVLPQASAAEASALEDAVADLKAIRIKRNGEAGGVFAFDAKVIKARRAKAKVGRTARLMAEEAARRAAAERADRIAEEDRVARRNLEKIAAETALEEARFRNAESAREVAREIGKAAELAAQSARVAVTSVAVPTVRASQNGGTTGHNQPHASSSRRLLIVAVGVVVLMVLATAMKKAMRLIACVLTFVGLLLLAYVLLSMLGVLDPNAFGLSWF